MVPELLAILVSALGVTGLGRWWWQRRAARAYVIRTRTAWVRAGTIIRYGPVRAICAGHEPRAVYAGGVVGALGITHRALVFDGYRRRDLDRDIPLDGIQHIALCAVRIGPGLPHSRRVVMVSYLDDERWQVSVFAVDDPVALAESLEHHSSAAMHDCGDRREDFGPAPATRLTLTPEGDWLPDRDGALYLALGQPGALIFDQTHIIPLADIAYIDVLGGARRVLRIEHAGGTVTGFEVADPAAWGAAIRRLADVPVTDHGAEPGM